MELIKYEDKQVIDTLKKTVAAGLTDPEFSLFVQFCQSTGLNPFKKEIWAIKAGGRLQLLTGINGFRAIANNHSNYDGIEIGLIGKGGEYLSAAYPGNDYIGAWSKCYRKDRRIPTEGIAMLADYDKAFGNWKTMRRVMIMKCAESVALRQAFPQQLNGLYTPDEMPQEFGEKHNEVTVLAKPAPIWEGPRFAANQKPLVSPVAAIMADVIPPLDSPNRPSAEQITEGEREPGSYVITTACKFAGKTLDEIYELHPTWVADVLSDPAKSAKLNMLDHTAMTAFVGKVLTQDKKEA